MKKYTYLKLVGLAVLTMAILVTISFLEVAVYSYLINPGHPEKFYDDHAMLTAPYVSGIFGFIIFLLVARHWKRKGYDNVHRLVWLFPLTYVLIDVVILIVAQVDWSEFAWIFILANGAKFLGSYLGYKLSTSKSEVSFQAPN